MTINVDVKNRVASYQKSGDEMPVCGNSGYKVKFTFDEEWSGEAHKTARFIWNGKYHDVEFDGDTCDMPAVSNTQTVMLGVYAGEMNDDGYMLSTTLTSVPFLLSARCGNRSAQNASGENYTNEARGYAEEAKAAAAEAKSATKKPAHLVLEAVKSDYWKCDREVIVWNYAPCMMKGVPADFDKNAVIVMPVNEPNAPPEADAPISLIAGGSDGQWDVDGLDIIAFGNGMSAVYGGHSIISKAKTVYLAESFHPETNTFSEMPNLETIYCNGSQETVTTNGMFPAPWGAVNATIIYNAKF